MALRLTRNTDRHRFELFDGDALAGFASFREEGGRIVLFHTEIEAARRGRGLGGDLVRMTLDELRREGRKVVPACGFVQSFLRTHPDYSDLVA
jgi:uncharacterized protein